ncbi:MAG: hypothetical protein KME17_30590 [Cyanosarcina radialis HA8281-LM2]|nr:hypothetical protein [Cyanosarcina radialis HA8281-LM2]
MLLLIEQQRSVNFGTEANFYEQLPTIRSKKRLTTLLDRSNCNTSARVAGARRKFKASVGQTPGAIDHQI